MQYAGECAALGTAVCWTASSLSFAAAGRRVGALPVNLLRLVLALGFLAAIGVVTRGLIVPTDASARVWSWLLLSGFVGFFVGDLCLFEAFVLIGPRLAMVIMCLWPSFAAVLSWAAWGETLTPPKVLGMVVTLLGVAWVTAEGQRPPRAVAEAPSPGDPEAFPISAPPPAGATVKSWGVALAVLGAAGQAGGYVLAQPAICVCDPFAATQIRAIAGLAGFAALFTVRGLWPRVWAMRRDRVGLALTANGALWGPCLGVALSLLALKYVPVGVAATLAATTPVLMIPCVRWLHHERVSWRAGLGACVAVGGVALLFLNPRVT